MKEILLNNLDIIYFFYGLAFLSMGIAILILYIPHQKSKFDIAHILWLLGIFGILHGFHEWAEIFLMIRGEGVILKKIDWVALFFSYVFLADFALEFYNISFGKKIKINYSRLTIYIIFVFLILFLINPQLVDIFSRYLLCFPSCLLIGLTSYKYFKLKKENIEKFHLKNSINFFSIGFYIYSISAGIIVKKDTFFPANILNTESFLNLFQFPVQMLRMLSAVIITGASINLLRVFSQEHNLEINDLLKETTKVYEELTIKTKQLEEANKSKSKFIANVTHELKTPLNSIIGFSEILIDKNAGPLNDRQLEYLKNIEISGRYLLRMILNILDISKFESRKFELNISKLSVNDTIQMSLDNLNSLTFKKKLKIIFNNTSLYIYADNNKFRQIIDNLLSNAIKFNKKEGNIEIRVKEQGKKYEQIILKYILIEIEDTGIGISKEDQTKIFDEFVQLDTNIPGTGLGLTLVKRFVELHGGQIWLESTPGKGSIFRFTLPLLDDKFADIYFPVIQTINFLNKNHFYFFSCKVNNLFKLDKETTTGLVKIIIDKLNSSSREGKDYKIFYEEKGLFVIIGETDVNGIEIIHERFKNKFRDINSSDIEIKISFLEKNDIEKILYECQKLL